MKRDGIIPLCVLLILMSAGAGYACGPFFTASYLVDGTERDGLVMTIPRSDFAMSFACIYTNQPPVPTNLSCAAYVRGRACLDKREFADAIGWFEQCREQARKDAGKRPGCADRSIGWLALAELHQGDYAACIRHYYECGDRRSLVSYVLPAIARRGLPAIDRIIDDDVALRVLAAYHHTMAAAPGGGEPPVQYPDAYFHYENALQSSPEEARAAAAFLDNLNQALAARGKKLPTRYDDVLINVLRRRPDRYAMKEAFAANPETLTGIVRDETCRRVLVAWIVARPLFEELDYGGISVKLLAAVETALTNQQVADVDGILRLAYNAGDYDAAERWLALSDKTSVITQWIESKLLLRQGRFDDARNVLRRLLPSITPASDAAELWEYYEPFGKEKCRVAEMVNSEIGLLELNRNDFLMAFDAFVRGKTWEDMAYVAEKVLTCDELDGYLRQHRDDKVLQTTGTDFRPIGRFRNDKTRQTAGTELAYLLARRYIRAGQLDKATAWMPNRVVWGENLLQQCTRFVRALTIAKDVRQSPAARADAYAVAARLATMELIGTETGPDWACDSGQFTREVPRYGTAPVGQEGIVPSDETRRAQRITGTKALYHATTAETSRVDAAWPTPCKRFHYRYYAADLAWQGAALLPCNSEKAARILHEAGCLLMSRDPKAAERFYKEIANRHGETKLGTLVRTKRWLLQASAWAAYVSNGPLQATQSSGSGTATDYCIIDVSGGPNAASYPVTYQATAPPLDDEHKTSKIVLRKIPAGSFMMGAPAGELGCEDASETQHKVTLTNDYYMGIYEITRAQYANVMGVKPAHFQQDTHAPKRPVEQVSWDDVRGGTWPGGTPDGATFMGKLRSKTGLAFDLPNEAQWEYACRAGTTNALNNNTDLQSTLQDPNMDILGRYRCNGGSYPPAAAVGSYLPNAWGLYDMHGNVWEWCLDWYNDYGGAVTDPSGPASGSTRVLRGGSWCNLAGYCRSAGRSYNDPDCADVSLGVRLVLSVTKATRAPRVVDEQHARTKQSDNQDSPQPTSTASEKTSDLQIEKTLPKSGIVLRLIPAGAFIMGNNDNRGGDEVQHTVKISKPFYMGKYEVTQGQWQKVTGNNPARFKDVGENGPVEMVNWNDCQKFLRKLAALEGLPEGSVRLPTEAEWEYACRAGTQTAFCYGSDLDSSMANFNGNYSYGDGNGEYRERTMPVGSFKPNAWGLYDMHGNVWEWCQDWYGEYATGDAVDPRGADSGTRRVMRGGSWYRGVDYCRSAFRGLFYPAYASGINGVRLVLSAGQ